MDGVTVKRSGDGKREEEERESHRCFTCYFMNLKECLDPSGCKDEAKNIFKQFNLFDDDNSRS